MRSRSLLPVFPLVAASAAASTFSVSGSGNTFIVTRSGEGTNAAETVRYRTVPLSAFPGQHYTATNGVLAFAPATIEDGAAVIDLPASDAPALFLRPSIRSVAPAP